LAADHTEIGQKSEFFFFFFNRKADPIRLNPGRTQPLN